MVADLVSQGFDAHYLADLQIDVFFDIYERYIHILQMKVTSSPMMSLGNTQTGIYQEGNKTVSKINLTDSGGRDASKKGKMR